MFHKNARHSAGSGFTASDVPSTQDPQQPSSTPARLVLVTAGGGGIAPTQSPSTALVELVSISAHRCSAFFAEAAVLVLVLALLDRYMAKGRVELSWVLSAFAISLALLAASIATDFTARRWLKAH